MFLAALHAGHHAVVAGRAASQAGSCAGSGGGGGDEVQGKRRTCCSRHARVRRRRVRLVRSVAEHEHHSFRVGGELCTDPEHRRDLGDPAGAPSPARPVPDLGARATAGSPGQVRPVRCSRGPGRSRRVAGLPSDEGQEGRRGAGVRCQATDRALDSTLRPRDGGVAPGGGRGPLGPTLHVHDATAPDSRLSGATVRQREAKQASCAGARRP